MKFAVIIDPIESLNEKKDSTIGILRAAQKEGLSLYFTTIDSLSVSNGKACATFHSLTVNDRQDWYEVGEETLTDVSMLDFLIMRKDPPYTMRYLYDTYWLDLAQRQGVLVVNNPQSLRDCNEKYFISQFPDLTPTTLISRNTEELKAFHRTHRNVIYKPLDGMGGHNIFHVDESGNNLNVIIELLNEQQSLPIMAQTYIPEIKTTGDKRILIIDGEVIPYALARIPQGDDARGNLARGAKGEVHPLSESDKAIAESLVPTLQQKHIYITGIDIIGDKLTEINLTSPTGIREIENATNIDVSSKLIRALVKRVKA